MQLDERICLVCAVMAPKIITVQASERNGIIQGFFSDFGRVMPAWLRLRA